MKFEIASYSQGFLEFNFFDLLNYCKCNFLISLRGRRGARTGGAGGAIAPPTFASLV